MARDLRVVLVGAAPAMRPTAGLSTYSASKAGVHALVGVLGRELAGSGRTAATASRNAWRSGPKSTAGGTDGAETGTIPLRSSQLPPAPVAVTRRVTV
jgi:NAD(P)-dependent dehydrogenase (short-subunit alcohol dehydrogenase family)